MLHCYVLVASTQRPAPASLSGGKLIKESIEMERKASTNEMGVQVAWTKMAHRGPELEAPQSALERGEKVLSDTESMTAPWLNECCEEKVKDLLVQVHVLFLFNANKRCITLKSKASKEMHPTRTPSKDGVMRCVMNS